MRSVTLAVVLSLAACGGEGPIADLQDPAHPPGQPTTQEPVAPGSALPGNDPVPVVAEPFRAEAGKWTWVDVEGARCADGSPTGVGVNLAPDSDDVLVFLQGGGACWDGLTCWGPVSTAFYVQHGYGRLEFATDVQRPLLPLRRNDEDNPFRRANLIYVPYCTGDVHSGDRVAEYEYLGKKRVTHHRGSRNLGLVLDRVAATVPHLRRLWLAGDSAGGFGSALNLDRAQRRFPGARVDVLDDSGQPIEPASGRWKEWQQAWGLKLPEDCLGCQDHISGVVEYYRQKYPNNRFGLISYTNDSVITGFMGLAPTTFYNQLSALADKVDSGAWPGARYYLLPGALHVGLLTPTDGMVKWLKAFASDDPAWESKKPF